VQANRRHSTLPIVVIDILSRKEYKGIMNFKQFATRFVNSKHTLWGIGFISFLESTILPIPLEAILIPLMQSRRDKLWLIAAMATLGCLIGALLFYGVGFFLFEQFNGFIMENLSDPKQFETIRNRMSENGFWFIFSTGITPVPLQVATLAAGVAAYNVLFFLVATALGRIIRYFGLAVLVYFFGNDAQSIIKKYKWQVGIGAVVVVAGIWWIIR
jgi:membrane protein YqaA with SNARE-associated domain